MEPLAFLNYDTTYTIRIGQGRTKVFDHQYCFGDVFKRITINKDDLIHYTIWINKNKNYTIRYNNSNYCFLSKQELYNHIKLVKKLFDFKFKIDEENDSFTVHIDIMQPKIMHKYLLTWIRYVYEFPMNVMFQDINRLKREEPCFRFTSKANLFLLLSYFNWQNYRDIHCIPEGCDGKFITNSELKVNIQNCITLNGIYHKYRAYKKPLISWDDYNYINQEDLDKDYEYRRNAYLQFYNNIK